MGEEEKPEREAEERVKALARLFKIRKSGEEKKTAV